MDLMYTEFDSFFSDHYQEAYQLAFLLCKNPKASNAVLFQALLTIAATVSSSPEKDTKLFFNAVLDECNRYYVKKLRREPTRERLLHLVSFPINDTLWQVMKKPFLVKAAVFLHNTLQYTHAEIAKALHISQRAVERLLHTQSLDLHCMKDITLDDAAAQALLDAVYLRFVERNVLFELKLRKLKHRLDHIVPYLAAAIILLCIAAIIYTANIQVF